MPKPRPNIVLLCPDEMGARALGSDPRAYWPGSTPFLNDLSKRSARFDQCHVVHTKCTPSRCALLTGQYPHIGGHRTLQIHTRPTENNLVRTLRDAGYRTALFGKNHVVDAETMPLTFDEYQHVEGALALEPADPPPMPPGSYYVGKDPASERDHVDVRCTDAALVWMESHAQNAEQPFFLWLNWNAPHPPYGTPAPFFGSTPRDAVPVFSPDPGVNKPALHSALRRSYGLEEMGPADWRELTATYLDMVRLVDQQVKRVVQTLERLNLADDTIVAFWSDHGDFAGEHQLVEKWDTCFYDCLTRVPFMLYGPRHVGPAVTDALVESIDILPTLLSLAGVEVPPATQGRSLMPLLRNEVLAVRDVVLCQGGQERPMLDTAVPWDSPRPCRAYQMKQRALCENPLINIRAKMIRGPRWKYVYRLEGRDELYDMQADPDELDNLAPNPAFADELNRQRHHLIKRLVEAETVEPYQAYLES